MNVFYAVTIGWSFAVALIVIWSLFRCKHHWELVDKTEMPSRLQEIRETAPAQLPWLGNWHYEHLSYRRVVLALRCSKCGRAQIHKIDSA